MGQKERVALFVDVQNIFYSARTVYKGKLDYSRLKNSVIGDRCLTRAIAYVVQRPDVKQESFYEALTRIGFEIKTKMTKNRTDSQGQVIANKGSYEVNLTVDALSVVNKVDTIILVTGDGNYCPLVQALLSFGCRVEIVGFGGSTSSDISKMASKFITIPKDWTFESKEKQPKYVSKPPANKSMYVDEVDEVDEVEVDFDDEQPVVKGQPLANNGILS